MADYKKSSVHCHSTMCDGKNTLQDMASAACAQGLTTLGFTGHSYTQRDREYCMSPSRTAQYKATIAKLKTEYKGKVDILCGIEWDLLSEDKRTGYDYWIGSALERQWGTAKFTTYYLSGMLLTVIGASIVSLITGYSIPVYGANYVNFAMFMAFALLYPDTQVLFMFIIPIRMKWLAYLDIFYFFFDIFRYISAGVGYYAILPVVALLNFVIFFWPELTRFFQLERHQSKQASHFHNTVRNQQRQEQYQQQTQGFRHKCAVCGRTDVTNPELQFRYCSKCAGYHCFCSDHIFNHVHFTDEQP